jgi:hypothetical protein
MIETKATLGEYNNYFSFGLFVELNEPLFVKKNWVPQWLWRLVSESRLSYSEHERQSMDSAAVEQVASAKVSADDGLWNTYYFKYNNCVNDPQHLLDTSVADPKQGQ